VILVCTWLPMILSKRYMFFAALALAGGFASYKLGLTGESPAQAINISRCTAGAFIAHAQPPATLSAEVPATDTAVSGTPAQANLASVATSGSNLVTNPGFDDLASGSPVGWSTVKTGSNNATFTQVVGDKTSRGVRVDISSYQSGQANWSVGWIVVQPGSYYQFTDDYRANVTTHATVIMKDYSGATQTVPLTSVPLELNWTGYTARFFVPTNVNQIQIIHGLDRVGSVETDNYNLTAATPGSFTEPLVSITFDGGSSSIYDNALPIMEKYGVVSTQYVDSGFLGASGFDSPGDLYNFTKLGHEVASASIDQTNLTGLTMVKLTREIKTSQAGLSHCYGTVTDFAAPYGAQNAQTTAVTKSVYQTSRSEDVGFNSSDQLNPYALKVQLVDQATTPAQIQAWLNTARDNRVWLILVYHQVEVGGGQLSRTPAQFDADVSQIANFGIPVKTVHDAYVEVIGHTKP
jgi:peptidoglycan/xylan/chitin deacetylase (PgdA/CDA1 family)